jgi:methylglutamate dehydrogenase subunit D
VPSFTLTPASSLGALVLPAAPVSGPAPGVTIAERTGVALCSMLARNHAEAQLADRVQEHFGIALPRDPRHTATAPVAFSWAGPSQWLALGEGTERRAFELQLRAALAGVASVIEQSDAHTIVRIGGPCARDALAKGVHIDLHPRAFRPGHAAVTAVAYIGVHFWQVDAVPTYEFAMFRSFAVAFCDWIVEAAAEFGVAMAQTPKS